MYQVIEAVESTYMGNSHEVVATYATVREANERVVSSFFEDGEYNSGMAAGKELDFTVLDGGRLRCAIQMDGLTQGYTEYYVQRATLGVEEKPGGGDCITRKP